MADANEAKKKALQLTLDKLDKTYGKGAVMKMGDEAIEEVEAISSGSLDWIWPWVWAAIRVVG